jgi:O-antigen biosynthesis protein WbqL
MVACVDITDCDRVSLASALAGAGGRAVRAKLMDGGGIVLARPMLWPCAGEQMNADHTMDWPAPDIDLYVVRDVLCGGRGSHLTLDGQPLQARGPYPGYIKYWYDNDIAPENWAFSAPAGRRLERAFVIAHFNFVWGHWLTEMYPKLFVIRALNAAGITAPLVLPRTAPGYVSRIIRMMLPDQEIITYDHRDETIEIGTALLPHMLNDNYVFHDFLRWSLEHEALAWPRAGGMEKVFVSRGGVRTAQSFREMENEAEIEGIAQELGLSLLRPETLSWAEQARIFSRARLVAGEFGSGLHNALLSPEGCQVVSLNWLVEVQSRIGNFRRHDVGYILPADGQARLYTIEPQANQPFTVDPDEFRRKLTIAVERAEARAAMAGWDDGPLLDAPGLLL